MIVNIYKRYDLTELEDKIIRCKTRPSYIVMNERTLANMRDESTDTLGYIINCNHAFTYKGIKIAICNFLNDDEIDVVE
jgi:hypothetical protein